MGKGELENHWGMEIMSDGAVRLGPIKNKKYNILRYHSGAWSLKLFSSKFIISAFNDLKSLVGLAITSLWKPTSIENVKTFQVNTTNKN